MYVIYCLILTAWQWLMSFTCIPVQNEPNKTHWGKGSWPFSFERSTTLPPQADHVLVELFSSVAAGGALRAGPHTHLVNASFKAQHKRTLLWNACSNLPLPDLCYCCSLHLSFMTVAHGLQLLISLANVSTTPCTPWGSHSSLYSSMKSSADTPYAQ